MKFSPYKSFIAIFASAIGLLASSCTSKKEVVYFQPNLNSSTTQAIQQKNFTTIQPGDILGIMVSSLSPEASAMFNPYQIASTQTNQTTSSTVLAPATGYMVDEAGQITLPLSGAIKIDGLSTKEATDLITQKLNKYLIEPTVNVRILNFKVSVLGEVVRPAVYTIANERITLPEALSMAGDLTIYGNRSNVLLIRETNGERKFITLDLRSRDIFNSPYYYLQSNDVIYVEPSAGRVTSSDRVYQLTPVIVSVVSLLTVIVTSIW